MASQFGLESLSNISEETSGYVILGSASNLDQNLPWHRPLAEFIDHQLKLNKPTLGICFGHQLMANYYGCEVGYLTSDKEYFKEIREIVFQKNFSQFKKDQKITLAYAHEQAVTKLSHNFEIVAHSERSSFECIRHRNLPLISTQAHPEASESFIKDKIKGHDHEQTINFGHQFIMSFLEEYKILSQ